MVEFIEQLIRISQQLICVFLIGKETTETWRKPIQTQGENTNTQTP